MIISILPHSDKSCAQTLVYTRWMPPSSGQKYLMMLKAKLHTPSIVDPQNPCDVWKRDKWKQIASNSKDSTISKILFD